MIRSFFVAFALVVIASAAINPIQNGDFSAGVDNAVPPYWLKRMANQGTDVCAINATQCQFRRRSDFDVVENTVSPSARMSVGRQFLETTGRRGIDIYQDSITLCPGSVLTANVATASTIQIGDSFFQFVSGAAANSMSGFGTEVALRDPSPNLSGATLRANVSATFAGALGLYSVGMRIRRNVVVNSFVRNFVDNVVIADPVAPTITCPSDITQNTDMGVCGAIVNFGATSEDNCGDVTTSYTQNPGTLFNVGTTSVTATATDAAGHQTSCTFSVTVVDNETPTFPTCPTHVVVSTTNCGGAVVPQGQWVANDNCEFSVDYKVGNVWYSQAEFNALNFVMGYTRVKARATDASGNKAYCKSTVEVHLCCPALEVAPPMYDAWDDEVYTQETKKSPAKKSLLRK